MATKTSTGRRSRINRRVKHAWSYGPFLRLADNIDGHQDAPTAAGQQLASLPWFTRMSATRLENDQRLFAMVEDKLRDSVAALNEAFGQILELDAHIAKLAGHAAQIAPADLTSAGGAEQHLTPGAVAVRRSREHQTKVDASQAQLNAARDKQQSLVGTCLTLRAQINEEFQLAQSISDRMGHFYARRVSTYSRRLSRDRTTDIDLDFRLDPAPWTTAPCPWLPPGLSTRLNTPEPATRQPAGTTQKES